MQIKNKNEFYQLYYNNQLGNRLRSFSNWDDLRYSSYNGNVSIRNKVPGLDAYKLFHVNKGIALSQVVHWYVHFKIPMHIFTFNESPPDDQLLIQGELLRGDDGLILYYSHEQKPLSVAMRTPKIAERTHANILLKHFLDPSSYDDIQLLLDTYDDAIIEFGVYSCDVGIIKNRNTIIWEVRNY